MHTTRIILLVAALGFAVSASARQSHQTIRQQIERVVATYENNFNQHDAAGIASLYTKDGMMISSAPKVVKNGPQEIEQSYQNLFKMGMNHGQITVDDVSPLGADAAIYLGQYHLTGDGQSGPLKVDGHYTAVAVRKGGTWKIRLATAFPNPPPAPAAAAAPSPAPAR